MHALVAASILLTPTILIQGGKVLDGTGAHARVEDIRIRNDRILAVGHLSPLSGEIAIPAKGLVVAPGFIDAHSHADEGIKEHPDAESQVRQGITTAVIGQDGGWDRSVRADLQMIEGYHPAINFAAFSGFGGIREKVLGKSFERVATHDEIVRMAALVENDMREGALGLSSGLEYNPGYYSSTEELIACAKPAAQYGGIYISHVRDETNGEIKAFQELVRIGREEGLPAQISHIKLAVSSMWGKYPEAARILDSPRITADIYPYLYWFSTISVLTNSRDWSNPQVWLDGLRDVGGPQNVRLVKFTPDKTWEGKTLDQLVKLTGKDAPHLIMEIIDRTKDGKGEESIVCTAMREVDLQRFMKRPDVMFCSDGSIGGAHPRGAGSFPRVLGRYVRDLHVLRLPDAIRKMTSLTADTFHIPDRGHVRVGAFADLVIFDPAAIRDIATPENPTAFSVGIRHVLVNGVPVLVDGKMTGRRGGRGVYRAGVSP